MADPSSPPLESALQALAEWFRSESIPGMVIGGIAASVLGEFAELLDMPDLPEDFERTLRRTRQD